MKTLFYGGKIITMAEPLYAEAVLVEDGRIVKVGSEEELRPASDVQIHLHGATMLPGFIDAHGHLTDYATSSAQVNLDGMTDFTAIKNAIQKYILENNVPAGEWVIARNYEHNLFPDARKLTMEEIDSIAPDHLLLIKHTSCHMGLVNSRILEKFGITPESVPPKNGKYVVENGKLTGCMEENACSFIRSKVPAPTIERIRTAHIKTQKHYASYGITTAQDGFLNAFMPGIYTALHEKGELMLDIVSFAPKASYEAQCERMNALPKGIRARLGGIKYFLDGSPQLRTAWVREPYLGGSGKDIGIYCHNDDEVIEAFRFAAEKHAQIIVHANGDAAIEQFLRCLAVVAEEFPESKELRHTIIHGQLMGTDQLARAAELGVVVSFFVAHTYHFADTHLRNLGEKRGYKISPTKSALENGVCFTFHQDAPVVEPNMLETVWCAVNRVTRNGVHLAGEEISVIDALRAVTVNAAYQYFEEDTKGTIEVGKLADFVVLDQNPLTIPKEKIRDIRVLDTYKNGECIYHKDI